MSAAFYTAMVGMKAAKTIHERLFSHLMKCPLSVFESLPKGRMMNRLTNDMATVDFVLPFTYRSMVNCVLSLVITIAVISAGMPWFLLVVLVAAVPYTVIQVCMPDNNMLPSHPT